MAVSASELFSDSTLEFLNGSEDKWDINELHENVPLDCAVTGVPPPKQSHMRSRVQVASHTHTLK